MVEFFGSVSATMVQFPQFSARALIVEQMSILRCTPMPMVLIFRTAIDM
jgi:hypothetical protein